MAVESPVTVAKPGDCGLKREMGLIWRHLGVRDLHHRLRLAVRLVLRRAGSRVGCHNLLDHRRHRSAHPGPRPRGTGRDVPGIRRDSPVPAPGVREHRRLLVRLLLLAAGGHGGADRVLRGDAVRVSFLARPLRSHDEERHRGRLRDDGRPDGRVHRHQLPGHADVRRVNNVITWWKVAIPVITIIVLLFKFPPRQLQRRRRVHSHRDHDQGPVRGDPGAGSCSPSASSRPTSWPGRPRTRSATCRGRSSSHPARHRDLRAAAGRVHRRDEPADGSPASSAGDGDLPAGISSIVSGPFARWRA